MSGCDRSCKNGRRGAKKCGNVPRAARPHERRFESDAPRISRSAEVDGFAGVGSGRKIPAWKRRRFRSWGIVAAARGEPGGAGKTFSNDDGGGEAKIVVGRLEVRWRAAAERNGSTFHGRSKSEQKMIL